MVGFDAYLKAFAALICLAFALIVLASSRRQGAHVFLGAFLLLLAGNQGAETLRALSGDPVRAGQWWAAATVFAAFDPLALYLFARRFDTRPQARWPVVVLAILSSALATAGIAIGTTPQITWGVSAGLLTFTGTVYAIVFAKFLRACDRAPDDTRARALLFAIGLVVLLPWQQLPNNAAAFALTLWGDLATDPAPGYAGAWSWVPLIAGVLVVVHLAGRLDNGARTRPVAARALGAGLVVTAILASSTILDLAVFTRLSPPQPRIVPGLVILGRASAALRWILFGALVSTVVVRDDLLGLSLARRRNAARVLVALGMLGIAGLLYAGFAIAFGADDVRLRPADWLLLVVVLVATQGFRPLIDGVGARLYGVPVPQDRIGAHEAYRRAVQQALAEGRDVREDPGLLRLRGELGLDPTQAALLERLAEEGLDAPLVAGRRVGGRYLVRRLVGRGGAGRVFLARDETLHRDVVLKEVLHDEPGDEATLREARAAGAVQHPNVVVVHDVLRRAGASLLVTEYVPGGSLAQRVRSEGKLPLAEGLRMLDGVLSGLEAVHARGLVHRDLKPDNVLLSDVPKLADFGIARPRGGGTARVDEPDAFVGTPGFMAPEQREGAKATPASDVYAVGLLARACIEAPLPPAVEAVIARALSPDPAARYPTAGEMRAALLAAR
ncbi:MAG TPA: serine/threonine-protein kinase [Candidatus Thermoplasmatota archaeon]|nr:serine/threonine-protein kinase [Candidatus Thermoplasmatota archaeon]